MNIVAAIVHGWVAGTIVEKELARSGCEGVPCKRLGNVRDSIFDGGTGGPKSRAASGSPTFYPRIHDEHESLSQNALEQHAVEEFEFWFHGSVRDGGPLKPEVGLSGVGSSSRKLRIFAPHEALH